MISRIVVGTDGSETATKAVREAAELAVQLGSAVDIVSAYAPVSTQRLREDARQAPEDSQWMVTAREDVDAKLRGAKEIAEAVGVKEVGLHAREGDPADAILD